MNFDYGKLKGRIVEKFGSQKSFAKAINRSTRTISLKLSNKVPFNQEDILIFIEALDLTVSDIPSYFFCN